MARWCSTRRTSRCASCRCAAPWSSSWPRRRSSSRPATTVMHSERTSIQVPTVVQARAVRAGALPPRRPAHPARGARPGRAPVRVLPGQGRHHRPRPPALAWRPAHLDERGRRVRAVQPPQGRPAAVRARLAAGRPAGAATGDRRCRDGMGASASRPGSSTSTGPTRWPPPSDCASGAKPGGAIRAVGATAIATVRDVAELHDLTALEAAAAVRSGEVSPVELVEHALDRIARLDGEIGAFVTVTAEAAREQARAAERAVLDGADLPPLHGVPTAIKDLNLTRRRADAVRLGRHARLRARTSTTTSSRCCARPGRSASARRRPRSSGCPATPRPISVRRPARRGTPRAWPAGPAGERRPRWPPASCRSRRAATAAGRSASRRACAAWSG